MKRDNVNYLLVGSFVLLMAAVLFYALYRITGHSAKGDVYYTNFANVAGIKPGAIVSYEGYEIGNVAQLEPVINDGKTSFRLALNVRLPVQMPKDSRAVISTPGLLSAPLVEISAGESRDMLTAGDEIAGASSLNLMASVAVLAADLGKITETSIKPLLSQLNQNITPAMADMRSTFARINQTATRIDALFSEQNLKHLNQTLQNADGASANVLKLTSELSAVRAEIEALLKDSRMIVSGGGKDLKESLRRVDATLYQLESAGRNLNEFSRTIRENPAALISSKPPVDAAGAQK